MGRGGTFIALAVAAFGNDGGVSGTAGQGRGGVSGRGTAGAGEGGMSGNAGNQGRAGFFVLAAEAFGGSGRGAP
jgi:hypothetical protein